MAAFRDFWCSPALFFAWAYKKEREPTMPGELSRLVFRNRQKPKPLFDYEKLFGNTACSVAERGYDHIDAVNRSWRCESAWSDVDLLNHGLAGIDAVNRSGSDFGRSYN